MKRSPIRRTRKPDPITAEVRAEVRERSGGWCEPRIGCAQYDGVRAVHMHHIKLRRYGDHSAGNLLHVCVLCHTWIHEHPAVSYERGWLKRGEAA